MSGCAPLTIQVAILTCSALAVLEFVLVANGNVFLSKLFATAFLAHLLLRIKWKDDVYAARIWWPVERVLFVVVLWDQWIFSGPLKVVLSYAKQRILSYLLFNPVEAYMLWLKVRAGLRWFAWGKPIILKIWGSYNQVKNALQRWRLTHRQRLLAGRKRVVVDKMKREMSLAESEHAAARCLQAARHAQLARRHVAVQRESTKLLAKWAASRIARVVRRHRARLQEAADRRPLLLRPDSTLIDYWKLMIVLLVIVEVLVFVMVGENATTPRQGETLGQAALRLVWPDCMPAPLARQSRRLTILFGRGGSRDNQVPDWCQAGVAGWLGTLDVSLIDVLVTALGGLVQAVAVVDTLIEYFVGVVDPTTGVLVHKSLVARYLQPPHSLAFNIAVNPALKTVNRVVCKVSHAENPNHFFRCIVMFQPFRKTFEEWVTPHVRGIMRHNAHIFNSVVKGEAKGIIIGRRSRVVEVSAELACHRAAARIVAGGERSSHHRRP